MKRNKRVHALANLILETMLRQSETSPSGRMILEQMPMRLGQYSADVAGQLSMIWDGMLVEACGAEDVEETWHCVECGRENNLVDADCNHCQENSDG